MCRRSFHLWGSVDGSVCVSPKLSDANLLQMVSEKISLCSRCSINFVGEHVCLRLSPTVSDSKSPQTFFAVALYNYCNYTTMATETLVYRDSQISNSQSSETHCSSQSSQSATNRNLPPTTGIVAIEAINRQFQERGFSENTRELFRASWRKGTQKDYKAKYKRFCSWCSAREINLSQATLIDISEFLTDLYLSGLQYRTIAGYRSMLSNIQPAIDGFKIGQHPDIIRLIKGVFHCRPPSKKLVLE